MELISILLSTLIGIFSPAGFAIDQIAENAIRSRFSSVEQLEVRVDNAPSYQVIQGKVEQVRIAGRGLYLRPEFRIAALDVETDPIDVNVASLRQGSPKLDEPLQAGVRVVLTPEDINRLLQSPQITERIRNFGINLLNAPQAIQAQRYSLINPRVTVLERDRLQAEVSIQDEQSSEQLALRVESGFEIVQGSQLQLVNLQIWVNGEPAPSQLVQALSEGVSRRLDLRSLQASGITARLLQLEIEPQAIEATAFVQVEPSASLIVSSGR
jgi:hypothetical protein